jgi:hypothetical protein
MEVHAEPVGLPGVTSIPVLGTVLYSDVNNRQILCTSSRHYVAHDVRRLGTPWQVECER